MTQTETELYDRLASVMSRGHQKVYVSESFGDPSSSRFTLGGVTQNVNLADIAKHIAVLSGLDKDMLEIRGQGDAVDARLYTGRSRRPAYLLSLSRIGCDDVRISIEPFLAPKDMNS